MSEVGIAETNLETPSEGEGLSQETFSIFILKSQPQAMVAAEQYLRNRKWIVGSTANLKEALAYIIQKQPQYVFLSADHTHKKIRVLPKLLAQAFPCRVIGFAERGGPLSMSVMNEIALEYNLYPPVSGPAIQRLILKIKKDDEMKAKGLTGDGKPLAEKEIDGKDVYTFKNDQAAQGENMAFDARSALSQLLASDGADTGGIGGMSGPQQAADAAGGMGGMSGPRAESGPNYYNPQQQGGADGSQTGGPGFYNPQMNGMGGMNGPQHSGPNYYNPQQQGGAAGHSQSGAPGFGGGMSGPNYGGANPPGGGFGGAMPGAPGGAGAESGPAEGESFADWAERMRKAAAAGAAGAGGQEGQYPSQNQNGNKGSNGFDGKGDTFPSGNDGSGRQSGKDSAGGGWSGSGQTSSPILESEYKRKEKRRGYKLESDPRYQKSEANDSIIVRGTQQAIDETMNMQGRPPVEVMNSTNVACILIQSPRFSGYLICAMGADKKVDEALMKAVQDRLLKFLKTNGEEMKDDEVLGMKIQEVDFQDWALEQADFLRKSVHNGEEIAMAFFPAANVETELEESVSKKMLQMKLDELREDSPLEFDLYIYMPENNKYLLYTPQGTPIYGKQKTRLQSHGVTHMHLKKESLRDVKKYRAQNFLNDKISAYKAAQKIKGPAN
jgi:hypothetical protein